MCFSLLSIVKQAISSHWFEQTCKAIKSPLHHQSADYLLLPVIPLDQPLLCWELKRFLQKHMYVSSSTYLDFNWFYKSTAIYIYMYIDCSTFVI